MRRLTFSFALLLVLSACGDSGGGLPILTTAGGTPATTGTTTTTGTATDSSSSVGGGFGDRGDAPQGEAALLEDLRARCAAGDFVMCDILYQASPFDSDLEAFADSCGERAATDGAYCADFFDVPYDLDQLRNDCGAGDMAACDALYLYAPAGSPEEVFGDECGGVGEGANRTCVVSWGYEVAAG